MANDTSGVFANVIAAADSASRSLKFKNRLARNIYWDTEPEYMQPFTKMTVHVPSVDENRVQDIGDGPIRVSDLSKSSYEIPFDRNYQDAFIVKEWVQGRSQYKYIKRHTEAVIEGFCRKVNRAIVNIVNSTNFPYYSLLTGANDDKFSRVDLAPAWANLAATGVDVEDSANFFFMTNALAWSNMVADPNFSSSAVVSDADAGDATKRAHLQMILGATPEWDNQLAPWTAGQQPGLLFHRNAIAGVNRLANDPNRPTKSGVEESEVDILGLRARSQVWYSPDDQGYKVSYNLWFGLAPARKEMMQLLQTT